ncbi:hypothetical protein Ciccas_013309, partial [Cichlidogyrus casuarinus]
TRETNPLYLINPRIMNLDGYIGATTRDQAPNPYPHNIRECIVYLPDSDDSTSVPSTPQPTHSPVTNSNFQPRPGNSPTQQQLETHPKMETWGIGKTETILIHTLKQFHQP